MFTASPPANGIPTLSSNEIQTIVRLKGRTDGIGPLRLSETSQAPELESISRQIASGSLSTRQLLLTTGLGLSSKRGIPARLPSLLVPGLNMMKTFQDRGQPAPPYLVYQATDFIADANGIPPGQARQTGAMMEKYLRDYIHAIHPSLEQHVLFRFGNDDNPETRDAIDSIANEIQARARLALADDPLFRSLQEGEQRHSSREQQSHRYAAANVLFSGADAARHPFAQVLEQSDTHAVFPIGGKAEKHFFALTADFAPRGAPGRPVIPLLTTVGSRPVYYPYPEFGDPCSPDELSRTPRDAHIRGDFAVLAADGATPDILRSIFPSLQ